MLGEGARVMLTRNLWVKTGLCNGAMGFVKFLIYADNSSPPNLPIAVIVQFDEYTGPSFDASIPRLVPITPILSENIYSGQVVERQQVPLKLCWAITIHKSQGLTLSKAEIDIGKSEKVAGLAYVAISRVKKLEDLLLIPCTLERLKAVCKSSNFLYRVAEEERLNQLTLELRTFFSSGVTKDQLSYFLSNKHDSSAM